MVVHSLELQSNIAPVALSQMLRKSGFAVEQDVPDKGPVRVQWEARDAHSLCEMLVAFLSEDWLNAYIFERIAADHPQLDAREQEYVSLLTCHAMRQARTDETPPEFEDVFQLLADALADAENRGMTLNLDAIVRFRMQRSMKQVESTMETMMEQFLGDREYEDFVSMLRYMLDAQPRSEQTLHVFCADERAWICDVAGKLIRDDEVTAAAHLVSEGEDVNGEDLAMSILIMRSPCNIVIHDVTSAAAWPSFSETVERVFLDRAVRCKHCTACEELTQSTRVQPETEYPYVHPMAPARSALPHRLD